MVPDEPISCSRTLPGDLFLSSRVSRVIVTRPILLLPSIRTECADECGRIPHVERVFHEALARAHGERARYIEKECSDSPSLCQEVEGLLVSHGLAGNFLEFGAANTVSIAAPLASGTR